jgi:hypothetical protein
MSASFLAWREGRSVDGGEMGIGPLEGEQSRHGDPKEGGMQCSAVYVG